MFRHVACHHSSCHFKATAVKPTREHSCHRLWALSCYICAKHNSNHAELSSAPQRTHLCACVRVCECICVYVCKCVHARACVYVFVCIYMRVHLCLREFVCVCLCVCKPVCARVYVRVCLLCSLLNPSLCQSGELLSCALSRDPFPVSDQFAHKAGCTHNQTQTRCWRHPLFSGLCSEGTSRRGVPAGYV